MRYTLTFCVLEEKARKNEFPLPDELFPGEPGDPRIQSPDGHRITSPRKIIDVSPETYYRQKAHSRNSGVLAQSGIVEALLCVYTENLREFQST